MLPISRSASPGLVLLAASLALAGCAGEAGYPSLALRPGEVAGLPGGVRCACPPRMGQSTAACAAETPARVTGSATPVPAPAPLAVAPVPSGEPLPARLDSLAAAARDARAAFDARRPSAASAIGAGATAEPGSERWALANGGLSALSSLRAETAAPLAELDRIANDDRLAHAGDPPDTPESPDTRAIRAATEAIAALVAQEDAILEPLRRRFAD